MKYIYYDFGYYITVLHGATSCKMEVILVLIAIIILPLLYIYYRHATTWTSQGIPSLTPLPIVGNFLNILLMRQNPALFLAETYKKFKSPVVGIFIFYKPSLVIRDPDLLKAILVKDFNHFSDRVVGVNPKDDTLGTHNLFSIKNPEWRQMRAKLTPVFTSGKIKQMFSLMNEIGDELEVHIDGLSANSNNKENIQEFREISAKFTTDVIATCAYGIKANSLQNDDADFRKVGRKIFELNWKRALELTSYFFVPEMISVFGLKLFEKTSSVFLRNVMTDVLKKREASGVKRNDLIDILIKLKNAKTAPGEMKFEGDALVAQTAIFFSAGFETSSTTMSFTLYELSLNIEIQDKLRQEMASALEENDGEFTYESVVNMPYLHMVVSETLRKYPPLPFLDRICEKVNGVGYRLPPPNDNVVIPPGTQVYVPIVGLHWDPEHYPDPERYDPERFSETARRERNPYTYLPFGTGPHNCIGERFGLLQTKLGILHVLKNHRVFACSQTPVPVKIDPKALILAPVSGLPLRLERVN